MLIYRVNADRFRCMFRQQALNLSLVNIIGYCKRWQESDAVTSFDEFTSGACAIDDQAGLHLNAYGFIRAPQLPVVAAWIVAVLYTAVVSQLLWFNRFTMLCKVLVGSA